MTNTFQITTPLFGSDYEIFKTATERRVDSVEDFTASKFQEIRLRGRPRLVMDFAVSELPLLVKRLIAMESESAHQWASDIRDCEEYPSDL